MKSSRELRSKVVSFRLTDEEHEQLSKRAAQIGVDLSELVRRASLAVLYPAMPVPPDSGSCSITSSAPLVRWTR